MKLSLSTRVAESFSNKREAEIGLSEFARIALDAGYDALCMRASQLGVHSSDTEVREARQMLDRLGIPVSMVTGDYVVPENSAEGPGCLRNITPYLDLAEGLGSNLIRICMKEAADIPYARQAADEANERNIRLAHQSHTKSLFETVQESLEVLGLVARTNFGLIYEPANLAICGQDYGLDALRPFEPHLFNVYLQNHVPDPNGLLEVETWVGGKTMSTTRPLEVPGGIDFSLVFDGLHRIGYDGYVTLHQAFGGDMPTADAATRSAAFLKSLHGINPRAG